MGNFAGLELGDFLLPRAMARPRLPPLEEPFESWRSDCGPEPMWTTRYCRGTVTDSVPVQSLTKAFALAVSSSFLVLNIGGSQGLPG